MELLFVGKCLLFSSSTPHNTPNTRSNCPTKQHRPPCMSVWPCPRLVRQRPPLAVHAAVSQRARGRDGKLGSLQSNGNPGRHQRDPKSPDMPLYQEAWWCAGRLHNIRAVTLHVSCSRPRTWTTMSSEGRGPRPPSGMLARTCHPLASGRARRLVLDKACPSAIPAAAPIDAAAGTHLPSRGASLSCPIVMSCLRLPKAARASSTLDFFLSWPPARSVP